MKKALVLGYQPTNIDLITNVKKSGFSLRILDFEQSHIDRATKDGLEAFLIDSMEDNELKKIGIEDDYAFLFCLHPDDAINLFFILSARNLNKNINIIAIGTSSSENKLILAGANKVIEPYDMTASKIFDILHRPLVSEVVEDVIFGETDIDLEEIIVPKDSFLDGVFMFDMNLDEKYNLVVIGILDKELGDDLIFSLEGLNHKVDFDDHLAVLGRKADIKKLREDLATF
jgi:voltage-gated potassium channel